MLPSLIEEESQFLSEKSFSNSSYIHSGFGRPPIEYDEMSGENNSIDEDADISDTE
mgnify:CR=1 FL=1